MKPGKWLIGMVIGVAMLLTGSAFASNDKAVVKADNKDDFTAVAAAIRQQDGPGGRWEYMSRKERGDIDQRLNDMQSLFDKYGTVAKMDDASKTQLFNDQEAVNEILTKRDGDRLVCERETPTGSNIPKKVCRTYAEIQREHSDAQRYFQDNLNSPQRRGGGG
ncbi:MAG: hypothetical protein ABIY40_05830 [Rhodanobacteraceae bacterium]|nr:hypothetical protein [Pseudomonadota bacterium]